MTDTTTAAKAGDTTSKPYTSTPDGQLVLTAAFRYAIGRRTYIVSSVAKAVREAAPSMSAGNAGFYVKEINEAEQRSDLGDRCDIAEWYSTREALMSRLETLATRKDHP